jgi:pimeloyl-ACP methyl ester carboxylesterase
MPLSIIVGRLEFCFSSRASDVPSLVVEGEASAPTLAGVKVWAQALPNGRLLLIPNAGHFPQVEQPHRFFPAIEKFLSGNGA